MANLSRERPLNMTEYICKQDAVDAIHEFPMFMECNEIYIYQKRIEKIPAADVAYVIRCGQCKYWQDNDGDYGYCYAKDGHGFGHAWGKNDFCSYGKMR